MGTKPIFYKMPVTEELLVSVVTSQYPSQVTTIEEFVPPVPFYGSKARINGMRPLENRHIVLQCFEAFRGLVVSYSAMTVEMNNLISISVA
jgi:hypothetical protein